MEITFKTKVVNLDSRPERYELIPAEMAKMAISDYERFKAFEGGTFGSVKSHIEVLKGVEGYLLVCEDDVGFLWQSKEIFDKAMSQIPEDFDLLYLGANVKEPIERYSENLFRIKRGAHTNHAILYSEKARNKILEVYNYETDEISIYDHWLYCVGQGLLQCYVISPLIAWQKAGYSDARLCYYDYFLEMRSNELYNMK